MTLVKHRPNRIDMSFGISVTDADIDETVLVAFIDEVYGRDAILKVLRSRESSFGLAMKQEFGSLAEFEKSWSR